MYWCIDYNPKWFCSLIQPLQKWHCIQSLLYTWDIGWVAFDGQKPRMLDLQLFRQLFSSIITGKCVKMLQFYCFAVVELLLSNPNLLCSGGLSLWPLAVCGIRPVHQLRSDLEVSGFGSFWFRLPHGLANFLQTAVTFLFDAHLKCYDCNHAWCIDARRVQPAVRWSWRLHVAHHTVGSVAKFMAALTVRPKIQNHNRSTVGSPVYLLCTARLNCGRASTWGPPSAVDSLRTQWLFEIGRIACLSTVCGTSQRSGRD